MTEEITTTRRPLADSDPRQPRQVGEQKCPLDAAVPWCVLAAGHEGECASPRRPLEKPFYSRGQADLAAHALAFFNPVYEGSHAKALETVLMLVRSAAVRDAKSGAGYQATGGAIAYMTPWDSEVHIAIEPFTFDRVRRKQSYSELVPGAHDQLDACTGEVLRYEDGKTPAKGGAG